MYFDEEKECYTLYKRLLKSYTDYLQVQHLLTPTKEHKPNILNLIFVGRHSRLIRDIVQRIEMFPHTTKIWALHLLQREYMDNDGEVSDDFEIDKEIIDTLMLYC